MTDANYEDLVALRAKLTGSEDLFANFEKLQTCRQTEVTMENLHLLAQYFGGKAVYSEGGAFLVTPRGSEVQIGDWVDDKGSRWNAPGPVGHGWHPAGTFIVEIR